MKVRVVAGLATLLGGVATAAAQVEYRLTPEGTWQAQPAGPLDEDQATIARARAVLAQGQAREAYRLLTPWVRRHESDGHPLLAQALLLRGDALVALGDEYEGLRDYEQIIRRFPASEEYVLAVERQLEIGVRYLRGMKRKWLGLRLMDATGDGEEMLVRVQERLPGSALAERAALELGDYYYRTGDLRMAAEAYEVFEANFPRSPHVNLARERRIEAMLKRFHGPDYDASGLRDARVLIEEYARHDPAGARRAGAEAMLTRIEASLAQQGLDKGRWYLRRGDAVSARAMLRRVVWRYPRTPAAAQALEDLTRLGWLESGPPGDAVPVSERAADHSGPQPRTGEPVSSPPAAPTGPVPP